MQFITFSDCSQYCLLGGLLTTAGGAAATLWQAHLESSSMLLDIISPADVQFAGVNKLHIVESILLFVSLLFWFFVV